MKKILFVLNNMNIGGTEKACLNLLETLSPQEYEVTLMLLEKTGGYMSYIPEWIKVKCMDGYANMKSEIMDPPLRVVKNYLKKGRFFHALCLVFTHLIFKLTHDRTLYYRYVLKGTTDATEYDAAIAYCGPFDFLTVYVLYYTKAAYKVQWIHFDVSKFNFNTKMCQKLYLKFQEICVVSDEARHALLKKISKITDKTKTRLNVVSREKCREMAEGTIGYTDDFSGIRIVTVGRLSKEKGQDIIPEIALKLKESGIDFRWYLIGDGKLREKIEANMIECGVCDNVVLLGTQSNPYPYLKEADIYVQTSIHEGYCITLAEAKAFDLPIVATNCAGAHEQLDELANGIVVERNVEELVQAIKKLLND